MKIVPVSFCFQLLEILHLLNPLKLIKVVFQILRKWKSEEECQRSIIGTYGEEISPYSPSGKGRINFYRMIYCISDEERSAKLKYITKLSPKDMKETAFKLSEKSSSMRIAVVCSQSDLNKSIKKSSTIVKLHL